MKIKDEQMKIKDEQIEQKESEVNKLESRLFAVNVMRSRIREAMDMFDNEILKY